MLVKEYFVKKSQVFLESTDKEEILRKMIKIAKENDLIKDEKEFTESILEREAIMSTDIGWQVAIPHAKLNSINRFFIIPVVLDKECDWKAGNNQKVKLVFMIGGPANEQKMYLQLLSKLSLVIRNTSRREALMNAKTSEDILSQFSNL